MNRLFFLLACCCMPTPATGAVVIFFEGIRSGDVTGNLSYANSPWDNSSPMTFTGTGDTRITDARPGADAEDARNVYLAAGSNRNLLISGIDTRGYLPGSFTLAFAAHKSRNADDMQALELEYSTDGSAFLRLLPDGLPPQPTGDGTSNWRDIELTDLSLPATESLALRFTNRTESGGAGYRLDNLMLSARAVPEPGSLALLCGGGLALLRLRRSRQKSRQYRSFLPADEN